MGKYYSLGNSLRESIFREDEVLHNCLQLFLPLVENDEILGGMRMRDGQEEDPVSEFIVHCRANFAAA